MTWWIPSIIGLIAGLIIDGLVVHPILEAGYTSCITNVVTEEAKNLCERWHSNAIMAYALIALAGFFAPFLKR